MLYIANHVSNASNTKKDSKGSGSLGTRANKESDGRIDNDQQAHIGGNFSIQPNPPHLQERLAFFDKLYSNYLEDLNNKPDIAISITLPNGDVKTGFAFKTTPYDIAKGISQGLADSVVIAKIVYSKKYEEEADIVACDDDEENVEVVLDATLWDMNRPLVGDCTMQLLKFDDPEAKTVFWHSSAHVLGATLEAIYGAHLTIGPPLQSGFYYDCFMGDHAVTDDELKKIDDKFGEITKQKHSFQRLKISREEAIELFKHNPFKVSASYIYFFDVFL